MSNVLFPTLPGLSWNIQKNPEFNTGVQRAVSLNEVRASFASTPLWNYSLNYDLLRDTVANAELHNLVGFFCARYGSFDSFLYADPDDSVAANIPVATGDGATKEFQLTRTVGAFTEQVCNVANTATLYVSGNAPTSNYSISSTGLVTFANAPASNAPITWTGTYYFRSRFKQDMTEFNQFMRQLWEAKTVEFVGSLGRKI